MEKNIRLYSYIITHDTGFAPNPFHGICTLACCKPRIRKDIGERFNKGENNSIEFWVVGISSMNRKKDGHKLVYMMKVTDKKTFKEYWEGTKGKNYKMKKPNYENKDGDNIYEPLKENPIDYSDVKQSEKTNYHKEKEEINKDLRGKYVLISDDYYYFGRKSHSIKLKNKELKFLYQSNGKTKSFREKNNFSDNEIKIFSEFIEKISNECKEKSQKGEIYKPYSWATHDNKNNICSDIDICK